MSFTIPAGTELVSQLIADIGPRFGFEITVTPTNGASTVTTTDDRINRPGSTIANTYYRGYFLWIPGALAANRSRSITTNTVSAGTTTFTTNGPTYSAGGAALTGYLIKISPTELIALMNDAMQFEEFETIVPLTEVADGDMQTSGVTNWADTDAVSSKVTTAANVYHGIRGLRVANSLANGRTATAALYRLGSAGRPFYMWAIVRADVGTARLRVVDTADASIDSVSTTEEDFQFIFKMVVPGSTIEEVRFWAQGDGATADCYWGAIGFIRPWAQRIALPAWAIRRSRVKALYRSQFSVSGSENGVMPALTRQLIPLRAGVDWRYQSESEAVTDATIELLDKNLWSYPLWIHGSRPHADVDTAFTLAVTETTTCDQDVAVARIKHLIGVRYPDFKELRNPRYDRNEIGALQESRRTQRPKVYFPGIGSRF